MDNVFICDSYTVLVVDDDRDQTRLVEHYLSRRGFNVVSTNNGLQIMDKIDTHKPDIILIDALMPYMDGFAICEELKPHAKSRNIPVVMMTSLEDPEIINWAFDCGVDDFIRKPFSAELLHNRLLRTLDSKREQMSLHHTHIQLETELVRKDQELLRMRQAMRQEILEHSKTRKVLMAGWNQEIQQPQGQMARAVL
ncbi:MAG: response regulator [Magnetococcales bacterium]|nr:response regulator [Magnetococcales bacterium]